MFNTFGYNHHVSFFKFKHFVFQFNLKLTFNCDKYFICF